MERMKSVRLWNAMGRVEGHKLWNKALFELSRQPPPPSLAAMSKL